VIWGDAGAQAWLVAVAAVAVLVWQSFSMKDARVRSLATQEVLNVSVLGRARKHQVWSELFRGAALICIVVALMRPQWGFHWQEIRRKGVDIMVVCDVSKSMLAQDIKPSRLERVKLALKDVVGKLRGDRIGLIAFAGDAFLQCPLTVDYHGFAMSVDALSTDTVPLGGTSFVAASDAVIKGFEGTDPAYRVCLFITDGENHEGDVAAIAKKMKELSIKVYAVGVGSAAGELIPIVGADGSRTYLKDDRGEAVKTTLDEAPLKDLALATGGAYVRSGGAESGIELMYEKKIAQLEGRSFESKRVKQTEERFQIFVGLALLFLGLSCLCKGWGARIGRLAVFILFGLYFCGSAHAADQDPRKQYNLGREQYEKKDYAKALDFFQRGLLTDNAHDEADAMYNIANTKFRMAQQKEKTELEKAVDLMKDAVAYYGKALDKKPKDKKTKENQAFATARLKKLLEELKKKQEQEKQDEKEQKQDQKTCPNPQPKDGGKQDKPLDEKKEKNDAQQKQDAPSEQKQAQQSQAQKEQAAQDQKKQDEAAKKNDVQPAQKSDAEKSGEKSEEQKEAVRAEQAKEEDKKEAQAALERFEMQEGDAMLDDRQKDRSQEKAVEKDW